MVKPGESSPRQNGNSMNSSHMGPQSLNAGQQESGDFSFVVLERSPPESNTGNFSNGVPSINGSAMMPPSFAIPSMESTSLIISSIPELSPEEVQKKLQDVLRENIELKETLQQNNLAMKQQFSTLIKWQEDVVQVHQSHKEKFEETRALIIKLRAENANLKLIIDDQPNIDKVKSENVELKQKVETLEKKVEVQETLLQENAGLKTQLAKLEHQLSRPPLATEAQQRAERRVCELSEERVQLMRANEELRHRTALLQSELSAAQADNFIVIENAKLETQSTATTPKPDTADNKKPSMVQEVASSPADNLSRFCQALDRYDERLMASYKRLDEQVDRFSQLYEWLQEAGDKLPSSSPALDMDGLQSMLVGLGLKLREAQASSTDHRLRLEEAGQQLGKLSSDFQGLLQEWLQYSKEHKEIQQHSSSYQEVQTSGFMEQVDHLTAQLLVLQEKLAQSEASVQQHSAALAQQSTTLAEREVALAQLEARAAKHNAALAQKEMELQQAREKLRTVEQNVDALAAQAEVYKMDFNEERESREKLAADKEHVADDLRAMQRRNQQLLDQLEECQKKLSHQPPSQPPQGSTAASGSRPAKYSYNTIATPGRGRNPWPEEVDHQTDREPSPPLFECPICQMQFKTFDPLQHHVELCVDMDMFP